MRTLRHSLLGLMLGTSLAAHADGLTREAAIGGAVGGALGGAVGAELGGREGAIIGAGVGAAAGSAINTQEHASQPRREVHHDVYRYGAPASPPGVPFQGGGFCPPGQAKKGRC